MKFWVSHHYDNNSLQIIYKSFQIIFKSMYINKANLISLVNSYTIPKITFNHSSSPH